MSARPRKLWRFIPFWPMGIVAIVGLLWWQRAALIVWMIGLAPIPGGWQISNLRLGDANLHRTTVEHLELVHRIAGSGALESIALTTDNLVLDYNLFTDNWISLKSIQLEQGVLGITSHPARERVIKSNPNQTLGSLLSDAQNILQRPLPVLDLDIKHLRIEHINQGLVADNVAVSIQSTNKLATATISYHNRQALILIQPRPNSPRSESSNVTQIIASTLPSANNRILKLSMAATEIGVDINAELNLEQLHQLTDEFGLLPEIGSDGHPLPENVRLDVNLESAGGQVEVGFNLDPLNIVIGQLGIAGVRGSGRFTVPPSQRLALPLTIKTTDGIQANADSVEIGNHRAIDVNLTLYGALTAGRENFDLDLATQSRLNAAVTSVTLANQPITIQALDLLPTLSATPDQLTIQPGFSLKAESIVVNQMTIKNPGLTPLQSLTVNPASLSLLDQPLGKWRVNSNLVLSKDFAANSRVILDVLSLNPENLNLKFKSEQLTLSMPNNYPAIDSAELTLTSKNSLYLVKGKIKPEALEQALDISTVYSPGENQATVTLSSSSTVPAKSLLPVLHTYFGDLPLAFAVEQGFTDFIAEAKWSGSGKQSNSELKLELNGVDISGRLDDAAFESLDLSASMALNSNNSLRGTVRASVESINYGVDLTEINTEFTLGNVANDTLPALEFESFSGILFDSRFHSRPFTVDLNKLDTELIVEIDNMDIQKLVRTQGIDDLVATGKVHGILPITINSKGVTITDGKFTNLPGGGRIQYQISEQQAESLDNPLTDIVITALKDFRYEVLTADADYQPNGDLNLDFHLEGVSPQLDPNRQVNLNINSQQNVLSLLRSLSYSDELNQTIDKQIKDNIQ